MSETDALWADLLNDYTKEILSEAAKVTPTLSDGMFLKVSADSDVVLYRPDRHWVGIRVYSAFKDEQIWEGWRGSLMDESCSFSTLGEAVAYFAKSSPVSEV